MQSLIGAANRLKIWEAIRYAKNAGIGKFDMGGYYTGKKADPQKEGINIFKNLLVAILPLITSMKRTIRWLILSLKDVIKGIKQ